MLIRSINTSNRRLISCIYCGINNESAITNHNAVNFIKQIFDAALLTITSFNPILFNDHKLHLGNWCYTLWMYACNVVNNK